MKKIIYSMIATAMLAVGCQKEELNTSSQQGNEVTFNLTTEGSMATRANNHPAGLRYTMELYMLNANQSTIDAEYAEPIAEFNSQEAASFSAILEEGIGYTALFWADYDTDDTDGSGGDYNTEDLLKVTINGNPKKEAFSGKVSFTFSSAQTSFDVTLTHAVAKVQYKQTVDFVKDLNTLKVTYPSTYSFSVEDEKITELLSETVSVPAIHTFDGIAKPSAGQTIGTSYIFAASGVQTVVDELRFQLNEETEKKLTSVPFQRNHTTNIIGAFSTAYSSTLSATCDDEWDTEHNEKIPFTSSLANLPTDATGIAADTWIITDTEATNSDDFAPLRTMLNSAATADRSISLEFPALTSLPGGALDGVSSVVSVSLPKAQSIGSRAIYVSKSLTKVSIATEEGVTVNEIDADAFGGDDLSQITLTTGWGNGTETDAMGKNWIVPDGAGDTNTITGFDAVIGALALAQIGDYYYDDDTWSTELDANKTVYGIVFSVNPDGKSGKAVSLDEALKAWSTEYVDITNAESEDNGLVNMRSVWEQSKGYTTPNSFDSYPAFAWVHEKNAANETYADGAKGVWYIPSQEELEILLSDVIFPTEGKAPNSNTKTAVNTTLRTLGATELSNIYWTSTQRDDEHQGKNVWVVAFIDDGYGAYAAKGFDNGWVRAILAF